MLDDGLCAADVARIDILWTTRDDYEFHYTDTKEISDPRCQPWVTDNFGG